MKARESHAVFLIASKGQILGHGMAHEIGHVLLHHAAHSPAGLMRSQWDRTDFENMVGGNLHFTSKEAERVRAEVSRRNAMQSALDPEERFQLEQPTNRQLRQLDDVAAGGDGGRRSRRHQHLDGDLDR